MMTLPVGVEDSHRLVFHQLTGNVGQRSSVWNYNDDDYDDDHDNDDHDHHDHDNHIQVSPINYVSEDVMHQVGPNTKQVIPGII